MCTEIQNSESVAGQPGYPKSSCSCSKEYNVSDAESKLIINSKCLSQALKTQQNSDSLTEKRETTIKIGQNQTVTLPSKTGASIFSESNEMKNNLVKPDIQNLPASNVDQTNEKLLPLPMTGAAYFPNNAEDSFTSSDGTVGAHTSGQTGSAFKGARPKLTASRTHKTNNKQKNSNKKLTKTGKENPMLSVDNKMYEDYKKILLNLPIPSRISKHAAVGAVLFMLSVSQTVLEMTFNLLLVKLGHCPEAVELYNETLHYNNEERIVLEFIEISQTEKGQSALKALQDNVNHLPTKNRNSISTSKKTGSIFSSVPNTLSSTNNSLSQNNNGPKPEQHLPSVYPGQQNLSVVSTQYHNTSSLASESLHFFNSQENSSYLPVPSSASFFDIVPTKPLVNEQEVKLTKEKMQQEMLQVLQKEQSYLKSSVTCMLCRIKPIEVTLLPCGHFVLCATCSDKCNICPLCKKDALAEVKTFLC